jgi:hypothetical protein
VRSIHTLMLFASKHKNVILISRDEQDCDEHTSCIQELVNGLFLADLLGPESTVDRSWISPQIGASGLQPALSAIETET